MSKVIVCGGRDFQDYELLRSKLNDHNNAYGIDEIVSGVCDSGEHTFTRTDGTKVYGADGLGEKYAEEKGIKVTPFPADWKKYGLSAGPRRNKQMAEYLNDEEDWCISFWDKKSKGTRDMISQAEKRNINIHKIYYNQ